MDGLTPAVTLWYNSDLTHTPALPEGLPIPKGPEAAPELLNPQNAAAERIGATQELLSRPWLGTTALLLGQLAIVWWGLKTVVTGKNQFPFFRKK